MESVEDRDRTRRAVGLHRLPPQRRGEVLVVLWINALFTIVVNAALVAVAGRAISRA